MKQEHHPYIKQTYNKGADSDTDQEYLGLEANGKYRDSRNARLTSIKGDLGAAEKINGHELEHDLTQDTLHPLSSAYKCIGKENVKGKNVSIWASPNFGEHTSISIDGIVMVQSKDLPWSYDFPVQTDKNDSCIGGELFGTDNNVPPMIFNIQDIIDEYNAGSQKYFLDFNVEEYTVNLSAPIDIPVFEELVDLGAGGGLPAGNYSYSIRYVSDDGDRTNFGPVTPTIAVIRELDESSTQYPYSLTEGAQADLNTNTKYGIKLRFRVNNELNYDFIEVRRYAWNTGTPEYFVPNSVIVGKIDIQDGEVSIATFVDPIDSNTEEIITDEEDTVQQEFIEKAKGIRYYDKRLVLMNIETGSREFEPTFETDSQNRYMYPCMQKLYKAGHADPYQHTYYKGYMGGENFGFAIQAYDGVAGKAFAVPIPNDTGEFGYTIPNRRTEITNGSEEDLASYDGMVTAANVNGTVSKTLEVFDHEDAVSKQDVCKIIGVGEYKNNVNTENYRKTSSELMEYCSIQPSDRGAIVAGLGSRYASQYQPWTPVSSTDNNVVGHGVVPNTKVGVTPTTFSDYRPEGFGLNYYSRGMTLHGVDGFPSWTKSFSIGRTKRANRVVCQGIGMWSLTEPSNLSLQGFSSGSDGNSSIKGTNEFWFFSPDIDSGFVSQSVIDGIANGDYEVQLVAPVGFFTETYNGHNSQNVIGNSETAPTTTIVDMISYARIIHDEGDINVGSDVSGYVYYNKWRNSDSVNGNAFSGPDGGDSIFEISSISVRSENDSVYYSLTLNTDVYNRTGDSSLNIGERAFNSSKTKDMQEPFYMVNIIESGKTQTDQDIDTYLNTGTYVKLESLIGNTTGSDSFELIDERWEDCIPALDSGAPTIGNERFVYVRDVNGDERAWMNVDYLTPAQINTIINDITSNGFYLSPIRGVNVYGVYTSTITQNANTSKRSFFLNFNVPGSEILAGNQVYVKYDKESPIRVFGGDVTVGESVFAPINREAIGDYTDKTKGDCFRLGIPFPYMAFEINPNIYQIYSSNPLRVQEWNTVNGRKDITMAYIRQMLINFTCETRCDLNYVYSGESPLEYFPRINYILRPHNFDDSTFPTQDLDVIYEDNNLYLDYGNDYGDEYLRWKFGGFRFKPQYNNDYSSKTPIEFASKKEFGFEEETKFCTRTIWSRPRAINQQDSAGLKTFLSTSVFDIVENNGAIKRAYSEDSDKGNNLYAFTDSGICLLLTNKSILSDLNSGELAYMAGDQFIGGEYWIERGIGMSDETWRTAAEGNLAFNTDSGVVRRNGIFFANKESVYRFSNNRLDDIGQNDYYARLRPELKSILDGYTTDLRGYYNHKYDEYGFLVSNSLGGEIPIIETEHFVFNQLNNAWTGTRDYVFDQFIEINDELYGMRDGEIHLMDSGLLINGQPILFDIRQVCAPELLMAKEFIRIKISSSNKPTQVNFYDFDNNLVATLDQASKGPLYLKNYNYWEQFIPRKDSGVDPDQKRIQGKVIGFGIQHNLEEDFKLVSTDVQYKVLK